MKSCSMESVHLLSLVLFFLSCQAEVQVFKLWVGKSRSKGRGLGTSWSDTTYLFIYSMEVAFEEYVENDITGLALLSYTSVEVSRWLACVPAAIGAALLVSRAFVVLLTALHAGGCESAGSFRSRTFALFQHHYRTQELTACHTLAMTLGKDVLGHRGHRKLRQHNRIHLLLTLSTGDLLFGN